MSYGGGLSELFGCLITIAVISVIGCIFFFLSLIFSSNEIESKELIKPEIRLEINNNKVDTIYVYKVK